MTWQFTLAGLLIGVLVGMTGMGGGSLMTPMLILLFGFDAKVAVGTDIFHGAIFKSIGAARHRLLGTVHARLALWMLVGSAPLSLVGVQIASGFSNGTDSAMGRIVGGAPESGAVPPPAAEAGPSDGPGRSLDDGRPLLEGTGSSRSSTPRGR